MAIDIFEKGEKLLTNKPLYSNLSSRGTVMDFSKTLREIKICLAKDFDEQKPILEQYMTELKTELENNQTDVKIICLLAMILAELRHEPREYVNLLEVFYARFNMYISDDDFAYLTTNMAFFYAYELDDRSKALELLDAADYKSSNYAKTYYALGSENFKAAENDKNLYLVAYYNFAKSYAIENNNKYRYCEAVCKYYLDDTSQALEMLEECVPLEILTDNDMTMTLTYATILALNGLHEHAKKLVEKIDNLLASEIDKSYADLADIMYIIGDYNSAYKYYSTDNLFIDESWIGEYYYSLTHSEIREKTYEYFIEHCKEIEKLVNIAADEFESAEAYNDFVTNEKNRLETIKTIYAQVVDNDIKPQVNYKPDILYLCYYINCPRHDQIL